MPRALRLPAIAQAQQHCAVKAQRVELKRKRKGQRRRAQIGFRRFKLFQTFTPVDIQRRFLLFGKARADKPCQIIAAHVKQQRILNERRRQAAGGMAQRQSDPYF